MNNFRQQLFSAFVLASLALLAVSVRAAAHPQKQTEPNTVDVAREVHLRVALLPGYSVFDYLSAEIENGRVVLTGQVVHIKLKSDAEATVKKVQGVTRVQNDVEVLPALASDDQLRKAAYRAIYGDPGLARYRYSDKPLIHIIVAGGNVALKGTVYDESDFALAGLRAKGVPDVSSVRNNLGIVIRVEP
jgi:hyperosmotically inducible protein